jgi:hypothetical protein
VGILLATVSSLGNRQFGLIVFFFALVAGGVLVAERRGRPPDRAILSMLAAGVVSLLV